MREGKYRTLNAISGEIERVDDERKWTAALELMLGSSSSVVALAKKMENHKQR